jgi:branched-chain amino acid transport system ATP-binding protein
MTDALRAENIWATYGQGAVLSDASIEIPHGSAVAVLGANGAGKTSLSRVLAGVLRPEGGRITVDGTDITSWSPRRRVLEAGLSIVPEGRMIFPGLTVEENLAVARRSTGNSFRRRRADVFEMFPRLQERQSQAGGSLSGGEQQMLAIGRALMAEPRYLILDEPSLGLSPTMVTSLYSSLEQTLRDLAIGMLVIEQNAAWALRFTSYTYALRLGEVVVSGDSEVLRRDGAMQRVYLGAE